MLSGQKIVLAVTGSIAAYKSCELLRLLIKRGAQVSVIMTTANILAKAAQGIADDLLSAAI